MMIIRYVWITILYKGLVDSDVGRSISYVANDKSLAT